MTIFLDLDGTILDIREKYNQIYRSLSESFQLPDIEYWFWRKKFKSLQGAILNLGLEKSDLDSFMKSWNELIESEIYLSLDKTFFGVPEKLTQLSKISSLVLCTSRKNEKNLSSQLDSLELKRYFSEVLVANVDTKALRIKQFMTSSASKGYPNFFFGDTASDMLAAKVSGIIGCGILSGLGDERELADAGAKLLFYSLSQVDVDSIANLTIDGED